MDTNHKIQDGRHRNQIARLDKKVSNLYLSVVEPLGTDASLKRTLCSLLRTVSNVPTKFSYIFLKKPCLIRAL